MEDIIKRRLRQKKYYQRNKEKIKAKKLKDYHKNRDGNLKRMSEYREKYIKPFTGKVGRGNYNITLAERNKEKWLKKSLILYKFKMQDLNGVIFYKYGLTKNLKNRLYYIPYNVEIIKTIKMDRYEAVHLENKLLQNVKSYVPEISFGGHTECFIK